MIKKALVCSACGENLAFFRPWSYRDFDGSPMNYQAELYSCQNCGLVKIANIDDQTLKEYYQNYCLYHSASGIGVGGLTPSDLKRYQYYLDILKKYGLDQYSITDIGCSRGGFLKWLQNQARQVRDFGVDLDLKSMPESSSGIGFVEGGALQLPFEQSSQKVLTYFHIFEHIVDLQTLLQEAERVLVPDGYLVIEVPDAERYGVSPVGSAFWMSLFEHVNHFSACSLINLLQRSGFGAVGLYRERLPMLKHDYPSLIVVAQKSCGNSIPMPNASSVIVDLIMQSDKNLSKSVSDVLQHLESYQHLNYWGCSYELFNLWSRMPAHSCAFFDINPVKQQLYFSGQPILDPSQLTQKGGLVISSYQSSQNILQAALLQGWPEEKIYCLT